VDVRTTHFRIPSNTPLAWRILWPLVAILLLLVTCTALVIIPIAAAGAYLIAALLGLAGVKPRPRIACPSCGVIFKVPTGAVRVCPGCDTVLSAEYTSSNPHDQPPGEQPLPPRLQSPDSHFP